GESLLSQRLSSACETGAVQIADERLFGNRTNGYDALIPADVQSRVVDLVSKQPGVLGTSLELDFAGLIGDANGSTLIIGRGLTPCDCVPNYECYAIEGKTLADSSPREGILGKRLAAKLGVGTGDSINIATGTVSGNFTAATVTVVGELAYSLGTVEEQLGLFPVAFVQRLLKTDGVERILVGLDDLNKAPQLADALRTAFAAEGIPLGVRTWQELSTGYASSQSFFAAFSLAGISVFALVFFSVVEILTISFLERTREVATTRAFGASRWRVFRGFLLEGAMIGAIGAVIGVILASGLVTVFNAARITWTPPGSAVPQAIHLSLTLSTALMPLVTVVLATLASSVYPAWKIARLSVVKALQTA
ncbi:MAG: FtsX-like permease family protein, partial [Candidatus Bipolaricaulota bacterium]|nr:FtsX-like permease family protein [Candidatus Bipolaricaulota bacterium]